MGTALLSVFDWNNSQNGRLLGFIGVLSTLLQGGYVRRAIARTGEIKMAQRGVASCVLALLVMTTLPYLASDPSRLSTGIQALYLAAAFLAFTSATVVNSLTAAASLQCDDDSDSKTAIKHPQLAKGRALGGFRSSGQLGRALGPLLACALYWTVGMLRGSFRCFPIMLTTSYIGPTVTYGASGFFMFLLAAHLRRVASPKVVSSRASGHVDQSV